MGETITIRAGSDLVLDAAVGGKPEPKVFWAKGDKELDLGEKYSLTYTSTRAMAIIKSCDRNDTGRYILTVKNASGIKTAAVNVKVLGKNIINHMFQSKYHLLDVYLMRKYFIFKIHLVHLREK